MTSSQSSHNDSELGIFSLADLLTKLGYVGWQQERPDQVEQKILQAQQSRMTHDTPFYIIGRDVNPEYGHMMLSELSTEFQADSHGRITGFVDRLTYWQGEQDNLHRTSQRPATQNVLTLEAKRGDQGGFYIKNIYAGGVRHFHAENGVFSPADIEKIYLTLAMLKAVRHGTNKSGFVRDLGKWLHSGDQEPMASMTPYYMRLTGHPFIASALDTCGGFAKSRRPDYMFGEKGTEPTLPSLSWAQLNALHGLPATLEIAGTNHAQRVYTAETFDPQNMVMFHYHTYRTLEFDEHNIPHVTFSLEMQPDKPFDLVDHTHAETLAAYFQKPHPLIRLAYQPVGDTDFTNDMPLTWELGDASFLGLSSNDMLVTEKRSLIGLFQSCQRRMSQNSVPPMNDLIRMHRLSHLVNDFPPIPQGDRAEMHMGIIQGSGVGKGQKYEGAGEGPSGGTVFLSQRQNQEKVCIDRVVLLVDPGMTLGHDALQDDIRPYRRPHQTLNIAITHEHFDHLKMEYYAKTGLLGYDEKNNIPRVKVFADPYVMREIRESLGDVEPNQWPELVALNTPIGQHIITDQHDCSHMVLKWCRDAALHSGIVTGYEVTALPDGHIPAESYFIMGDGIELTPQGQDFAQRSSRLMSLVKQYIPVKHHHYWQNPADIALRDTTSPDDAGFAPRPNDVSDFYQNLFKALGPETTHLVVPFSTNHREIQAVFDAFNRLGRGFLMGVSGKMAGRMTKMNTEGVLPLVDLSSVEITPEMVPQTIYAGIMKYFEAMEEVYRFRVMSGDASYKDRANLSMMTALIKRFSNEWQETGQMTIPSLFYEFLNKEKQEGTREDLKHKFARLHIQQALQQMRKKIHEDIEEESQAFGLPDKARKKIVQYLKQTSMVSKAVHDISKYGKIIFKKNNINGYLRWSALKNQQEYCCLYRSKDTQFAKIINALREKGHPRMMQDHLGILTTGPTAEMMSAVERLIRFNSPFSHRPEISPSGVSLRHQDVFLHVMQPAIPVGDRLEAQEQMIQKLGEMGYPMGVAQRRAGWIAYHASNYHAQIRDMIAEQGEATQRLADDQIFLPNAAAHFGGHGREDDFRLVTQQIPAPIHCVSHIGKPQSGIWGNHLIKEGGKAQGIVRPQNRVFYRPLMDPKTQEVMPMPLMVTGTMTPAMLGIKEVYPFEKFWSTQVFMRVVVSEMIENPLASLNLLTMALRAASGHQDPETNDLARFIKLWQETRQDVIRMPDGDVDTHRYAMPPEVDIVRPELPAKSGRYDNDKSIYGRRPPMGIFKVEPS